MTLCVLLALALRSALLQADPAPAPTDPVTAQQLLDEAIDVLAARPLGRERVDWPKLRTELAASVPPSDRASDAHAAIRRAVAALGDRHARFVPPAPPEPAPPEKGAAGARPRESAAGPQRVVPSAPEGRMLDDIAYIVVPMCSAPDAAGLRSYATALRGLLLDLEQHRPAGWLIELRFNGGGNVWPMLVGLQPLLGDGPLAGSHDGTERTQVGCAGLSAWIRRGDGSREEQLAIPAPAGDRRLAARPVAVLVGSWTMSSGEMLALALAGHDGARLFGEPTGGLTTATDYFPLRDGSVLNLPVSRMTDRQGNVVTAAIEPHERVESADWPSADDAPARAARRWLAEQAPRQTAAELDRP